MRGADPQPVRLWLDRHRHVLTPVGAPAPGRPDASYARVSRLASVDIVYVPMPMITSSAFCSV